MNKKLPDNAKLVHKGIIFDTYQWEQEMFDGSIQIFEAIKRNPTVQIIPITENNKIIVLEEEQPHIGKFIGLVGGHVEDNETPEENAIKELLEETGMKCEELILWKKEEFGSKIIWDSYYFIARNCKIIQDQNLEVGEKIKVLELDFLKFIEFTQKNEFRNKSFQDMIFRMIHTNNELKKFEHKLFN